MRLKQLLGILALLAVCTTFAAAAAVSQLTDVRVSPQAGAAVVAIKANGTFTHTEYRPVDNLLLVDLAGVSAGKLEGKTEQVSVPGVSSYRVIGYKGNDGAEIARIEIALAPGASVKVNAVKGGLHVNVSGVSGEQPVAAAAEKPAQVAEPAGKLARLQGVSVSQGQNGLEIEIAATSPIFGKTMRLQKPDRLVVDIANSVPPLRNRLVSVNSGHVKSVRMAQFQSNPPATRVVVDLLAPQDFELVPDGNKLRVVLSGAPAVAAAAAPAAAAPAEPAPFVPAIEAKATPKATAQKALVPATLKSKAQAVPLTQPTLQNVAVEKAAPPPVEVAAERQPQDFVVVETKPVEQAPLTRAAEAASKFAAPAPEIPLSNYAPVNAALKPQSEAAVNMAMLQQQQLAQVATATQTMPAQSQVTGCSTGRYTGEPISVNLKDVDLKDFFRLIHEISGLNIVLDPNVRGSLTIVLDDVPWDQALSIVLKNNNLDCQLEGNVLRIATLDTMKREADARRAQIESQSLAVPKVTFTRYLSYAHSKDVVPTIKKFLSARGEVISDDRTNALIIEDIPGVIPNIDRLIRELDRKTQEVEIEARVVAATRNFARDIGTQLGFGWGNRPSAVGGATAAGQTPIQVGGLTPNYIVTGTNQIPLFSNMPAVGATSGISFTNATNNYRLDFVLTMAESRGLLKILSRPRVVTQNNIKAVVKQGVRIPVVTAAQLGGPPTTTYIPAELRLTVTPQITAEGTIFLDVDVENTTPDFGNQVNGQPTLITQQATTQVLVTDGGTVVIGGVIQTQNSVTQQQVPLLGDIPILGNLFKRRAVSTSTQELIFFITPKIIQT